MSAKFIKYKDTNAQRGSDLYKALEDKDPIKAEAVHALASIEFKKHWDVKYNHLLNWSIGNGTTPQQPI
jgi:predicted secreted Zn-dependent protease